MVGRLIIKVMPWWVFGLIAVAFVPLTSSMIRGTLDERAEARFARQSAAPPLLPIAQLTPRAITAPLGEVHLSGRLLQDIGPWERQQKGVNFSYLAVAQDPAAGTSAPRYVLVYFESYLTDLTLERLAGQTDDGGIVTVRGFVKKRSTGLPPEAWLQAAVPNGRLQAVIEPYFGTRDAAIDDVVSDSAFVSVLGAAFNVLFFAMALFKFRAWRKRARAVATARPTPTVVKRAKAASSPRSTDDFANSPIQSGKKGWF